MISPRRWGKSSLVNRALEMLKETPEDYIVIKLDAFNLKTREEFKHWLVNNFFKEGR